MKIHNNRGMGNDTLVLSLSERLPANHAMTSMIAARIAVLLATALSIALLTRPSMGQPLPGGVGLRSNLAVADCGQARDPARCLAMQQARKACREKRGADRRQCLREKMPAPDCSQAPDPVRCEARRQAHEACQGKTGKELRSCLRNFSVRSPPPRSSLGLALY